MASSSARPVDSCSPAPYGQACAGCSRAKNKCFYRSDGSGCERCHRLGKVCGPSVPVRRQRQPRRRPPTGLEEKLDDLVTLLRSQAAEKQSPSPQQPLLPTPINEYNTPSTLSGAVDYGNSVSSAPARDPDIVIDTTTSVVHLYPASANMSMSPVLDDVSIHHISDRMEEEQLDTFRRAFIPMFPFIHIPTMMSSSELRRQSPFLWLVIMSLSTKLISNQFAMEETIWQIVSQRIVSQHLADLDLLLGILCFASWSHYFKKDKPFMTTLCQLAVSLAFELGLHKDAPKSLSRQTKSGRVLAQQPTVQHARTVEERRTILAVFHLTSSTWTAYRKTEPLRWTPYMDDCLRILGEGSETVLDVLLVTQIKCQIITNQLSSPQADGPVDGEGPKALPAVLVAALLQQVNELQQCLPNQVLSERTTQFYLYSTKLTIQDSSLNKPRAQDQTGHSHFRRLQDLDSILTTAERWLEVFSEMPIVDWVGINVDMFSQFTHCLVVLFKLTTLEESGWDSKEVRRRADVFDIIDNACETIDRVPVAVGMIDADGPRRGLFFKTTYLLRAIKALFLAEMPPNILPDADHADDIGGSYNDFAESVGEVSIPDDFLLGLSNEPWMSDIFGYS